MSVPPIIRMAHDVAKALGATPPPISPKSGLALIHGDNIFVWATNGEKLVWGIVPEGIPDQARPVGRMC